jgi:hypothetical protein
MSKSNSHDDADAGLERMKTLEGLLTASPVNSLPPRRKLADTVRSE